MKRIDGLIATIRMLQGLSVIWLKATLFHGGKLSSLSAIRGALAANRFHRQVAWGTQAAILKVAGDTEGARSYLAQLQDVDPVKVKVFASSIGIDLSP
jgi:hypothetical protein